MELDDLLCSYGYPTIAEYVDCQLLLWNQCFINERTLGGLLGNGVSLDMPTPLLENVLFALGYV